MASSIVHLAVTSELARKMSFRDPDRLKFGAVLVDAGEDGGTGDSHLTVHVRDGKRKSYDFGRFREMFGDRMLTDDLYMGYYLHLVQDALYRHYVYDRYQWDPTVPGNTERLHKDYRIVNPYIIRKYRLKNEIAVPAGWKEEAVHQICSFDTEGLIREMNSYFLPAEDGPVFFFTKEMSEEFIGEAVEHCAEEVKKLRNGEQGMDMLAYAWDRAGERPAVRAVTAAEHR